MSASRVRAKAVQRIDTVSDLDVLLARIHGAHEETHHQAVVLREALETWHP
ncbi:MAG: hypothetical protein LBQ20_12715 [Rhodanobacter sp.]|nr:hypothetical protein [Rhodanobacter sp.]